MQEKQKSKYKGVSLMRFSGKYYYWTAQGVTARGRRWQKRCNTEREAAIAFDKKMIELGREPVNVLIKKN